MFRLRRLLVAVAAAAGLTAGTATAAPIQAFGGSYPIVTTNTGTISPGTTYTSMNLASGTVSVVSTGGAPQGVAFAIAPPQSLSFAAVTSSGGPVTFTPSTFAFNAGPDAYTFTYLGAGVPLNNGSGLSTTAPQIGTTGGGGSVAGALTGFVRVTSAPATPTAGPVGDPYNFGPVGTIYSLNQAFSVQGGNSTGIQLVNGGYQITFSGGPNPGVGTLINSAFTFGRIQQVDATTPPVPEPATIGTFAVLGLAGLIARRKMKKTVA